MSQIIFDNHALEDTPDPFVGLPLKSYLLKVLEENKHVPLPTNAFDRATHVMAHWESYKPDSDIDNNYIPEQDRFRSACINVRSKHSSPLIILRVSIGGQDEQRQREDEEWKWPETGKTLAYVLNARNQQTLQEKGVLEAFYSMTHEDARSVYEGKLQYISVRLRPLFQRQKSPYTLSALSILCQGYLAVHANSAGQPEGILDEEYETVKLALKRMKWPDFCLSRRKQDLLCKSLSNHEPDGPGKRESLRKETHESGYWIAIKEVLNGQSDESINAITSIRRLEWDALTGEAEWTPVKTLLEAVFNNFPFSVDATVVANAFIQLANRLGDA